MSTVIAVAVGGAFGAVARFAAATWLQQQFALAPLPIGTFAVNVGGAFLLGVVLSLFPVTPGDSVWIAAVAVGFLGSFTTFSTFSWEIVSLMRDGLLRNAAAYVVLSLIVGVAGTLFGVWVGQKLLPS